jgi:hypothetical protein
MGNRSAAYRQADVTRALKGAIAAGVKVAEVHVSANGIRIIVDDGKKPQSTKNCWDEKLNET